MPRPICEPIDLPLGATVLIDRVEHRADSPELGRLLHFHDVSELVIFEQVEGIFIAGGRRHPIESGSIIFAPSMRHHDFELAPGPKAWWLVQIDPYLVEQLALQRSLDRLARPFCVKPNEEQRRRIETLTSWLAEMVREDPRDPLVGRIVELLLLAVAQSPEVEVHEEASDEAHVDRLLAAVERLRSDPQSPISLEEAAARCSLSPPYFSRRFKQVFGMNFVDYRRAYRLHLAARRLASTGAPISDIAYGLGFSSPSHFSARFHDRFGLTPRDYRGAARRRDTSSRASG